MASHSSVRFSPLHSTFITYSSKCQFFSRLKFCSWKNQYPKTKKIQWIGLFAQELEPKRPLLLSAVLDCVIRHWWTSNAKRNEIVDIQLLCQFKANGDEQKHKVLLHRKLQSVGFPHIERKQNKKETFRQLDGNSVKSIHLPRRREQVISYDGITVDEIHLLKFANENKSLEKTRKKNGRYGSICRIGTVQRRSWTNFRTTNRSTTTSRARSIFIKVTIQTHKHKNQPTNTLTISQLRWKATFFD